MSSNVSDEISEKHDDVIKWKHIPRNWPYVRGIHRSRWIPHTKASNAEILMFSLICVWINDSVNNREAGDLRRHRGHYGVYVMNAWINIDGYVEVVGWVVTSTIHENCLAYACVGSKSSACWVNHLQHKRFLFMNDSSSFKQSWNNQMNTKSDMVHQCGPQPAQTKIGVHFHVLLLRKGEFYTRARFLITPSLFVSLGFATWPIVWK